MNLKNYVSNDRKKGVKLKIRNNKKRKERERFEIEKIWLKEENGE